MKLYDTKKSKTIVINDKIKPFRSFDKRMLFYIIFCSSFVTALFTSINFYFDYTVEIDLLNSTFSQIEKATAPSLATDIWDLNEVNMTQHVNSVMNIKDIVGVWVVDEVGELLIEKRPKGLKEDLLVKRSYSLDSIIPAEEGAIGDGTKEFKQKVGTLYVLATKENMYKRLFNKLVLFFVTQGLKTFFVSFCILFIFQFFVISHLSHVTSYLMDQNFRDIKSSSSLILSRGEKGYFDELDILTNSINNLKSEIITHNRKREEFLRLKEKAERELQILNKELDQRVKERTDELKRAQSNLIERAHKAGMADIAKDSLHNIGNLISSTNIALQILQCSIRDSQNIKVVQKSANLIDKNQFRLMEFFSEEKGQKIQLLLPHLLEGVINDYNKFYNEANKIKSGIEDISSFLSTQQGIVDAAASGATMELTSLKTLLNEAISVNHPYLAQQSIRINAEFNEDHFINVQKYKFIFIVTQIIRNAAEAMEKLNKNDREIKISLCEEENIIRLDIFDPGIGISKANITKIFSYGFSTRSDKKGEGLHLSANYMTEMKGKINVHSDGAGRGATVSLRFAKALDKKVLQVA